MIKYAYKKPLVAFFMILMITAVFAIGAAAMGVREGASPSASNNPTGPSAADSTAADQANDAFEGGAAGAGVDETQGGMSGTPSESAPGTGEFADDTTGNDSKNPAESAIDGVITDGSNALSDAMDSNTNESGTAENGMQNGDENADGFSIWGIIIAIVVVAAVAALVLVFVSKKK